jgi:hypothetical protein
VVERLVLAVPMPVEWRAGFAHLALTSGPRPAYLLGTMIDGNPPWFFPASAVIKLPLTATVATLSGWVVIARDERLRRTAAPAVLVGAVLAAVLLVQDLALGLRLAMPVIALAFVGAAGLARLRRSPIVVGVLALVAVGQLAATVAAHPASLAWTPPPFGAGYRAASDSSIDFGQALFAVRDEAADDPLVASTTVRPRGIPEPGTRSVLDTAPEALVGRVAVSVTALTVLHRDELSWLRAYCPVDVIEGAVLIYEFDRPPDRSPGPDVPAAPCDGAVSRRS